jgi:iron complex outermembrane receptor protein
MRKFLLTTTAMLLAMPAIAHAEDMPAPQDAAPAAQDQADEPEGGLAEIVVTAQRKAENLQRAAVAVDVAQGDELRTAGITSASRLNEVSPGLTVQSGGTGSIFFVRGVGNFTVSPNSDPAVAFNYDGVYVGRPSSTSGVFFDLDRVEVLKGPQGTLYGRNATGGAINVLPTQPKIGGPLSGYASASYGNFESLIAEGALNVPMGENGAARISASVARHDGYRDDGTDDDKTWSLRLQMKANLTPNLTVRVAGDYSHTGGAGASPGYVGHYAYSPAQQRYNLVRANRPDSEGFYSPGSQAYRLTVPAGTAGRRLDALGPYQYQNNDFYGFNADIIWETGAGTLTVTPAWRYAHLDLLSSTAGFMYAQDETDEQFSVEARFTGKRLGIFDYTAGIYYFDEKVKAVTALSLSSAASWLSPNYTTESYAPFGRVTANITDQLRLVGGIRYTKDDKTFVGPTISGAIVCTVIVQGVPTCPNASLFPLVAGPANLPFGFPPKGVPVVPNIVGGVPTGAIVARTDRADNSALSNDRITWRAAVEYDLGPQSLLYASYETGYRSGGFSPAQGFETYQPEYLYAWTVGTKNRFLDNRLQLNVEGFWWDYKNQQVNHVGLDQSGRTANFTQNIGASRIKGVQVETRFLATPNTLLSADVQYLDATNKTFLYQQAVGTPGTPPPLTGCAVRLNANPTLYDVDCAGKMAYNSPKWTLNLAAQQTIPLGEYKIVLGADTQFRSRRAIGFAYLAEQYAPANWQSNAQIMVGPQSDTWSIAAFVRNIEGDRNPVFYSTHPTTNILALGTTPPRTYGVRLSGKF